MGSSQWIENNWLSVLTIFKWNQGPRKKLRPASMCNWPVKANIKNYARYSDTWIEDKINTFSKTDKRLKITIDMTKKSKIIKVLYEKIR